MSGRTDYYTLEPTSSDVESCRACTDFKSWTNFGNNQDTKNISIHTVNLNVQSECPLDRQELGQKTWSLLHTMAASYPEKPSVELQNNMSEFITVFSKFYPCAICADHLRKQLVISPPLVGTQEEFKEWLCWIHNNVNRRLGKPLFDCKLVDERWKIGKGDSSCKADISAFNAA